MAASSRALPFSAGKRCTSGSAFTVPQAVLVVLPVGPGEQVGGFRLVSLPELPEPLDAGVGDGVGVASMALLLLRWPGVWAISSSGASRLFVKSATPFSERRSHSRTTSSPRLSRRTSLAQPRYWCTSIQNRVRRAPYEIILIF